MENLKDSELNMDFNVNIICKQYGIPVCALAECTSTVVCIRPDDGSVS
jgi:hypothetical protein